MLLDDHHPANLGDVLAEIPLDPKVQGDVARWAPDAGPVEADIDRSVGLGFDELNIAAVGLDRRADRFDHSGDAIGEVFGNRRDIVGDVRDHRASIATAIPGRVGAGTRSGGRRWTCPIDSSMNRFRRQRVGLDLRERLFAGACIAGLLGTSLAMVGGGCAGPATVADGDTLTASRNAGLTPGERVRAITRMKAEVAAGTTDRVAMRHAMTELAWALETPEPVRAAALEALLWDDQAEQESLELVQEMLPTEPGRQCVAVMATAIADHGWIEATPMLVRSLARPVEGVADRERAEYLALEALYPNQPIEQVAFDAFLEPKVDAGPAGLGLDMRTREAGWELVGRLAGDGDARARLLQGSAAGDDEGRALLGKLRQVYDAFGVVPRRAEEMRWAARLADEREGRLRAWWSQAQDAASRLGPAQREGLALRHLEAIRWAGQEQAEWLAASREQLLSALAQRLRGRQLYARTEAIRGTANANAERLATARDGLVWGDALVLLVIDRALADEDVRSAVFEGADKDNRDRRTEHGGTLWTDAGGFHVQPFSPRGTATPDDRRFVAPREMIDFSSAALAHFHYHVTAWRNRAYSGPSPADLDYAARFGRACAVFTGITPGVLDVDVYFPNGTVVDLGEVRKPALGR